MKHRNSEPLFNISGVTESLQKLLWRRIDNARHGDSVWANRGLAVGLVDPAGDYCQRHGLPDPEGGTRRLILKLPLREKFARKVTDKQLRKGACRFCDELKDTQEWISVRVLGEPTVNWPGSIWPLFFRNCNVIVVMDVRPAPVLEKAAA